MVMQRRENFQRSRDLEKFSRRCINIPILSELSRKFEYQSNGGRTFLYNCQITENFWRKVPKVLPPLWKVLHNCQKFSIIALKPLVGYRPGSRIKLTPAWEGGKRKRKIWEKRTEWCRSLRLMIPRGYYLAPWGLACCSANHTCTCRAQWYNYRIRMC